MAAVTICSDFGAQKNSLTLFPLFPHLFPMKWWDQMPLSSFSECWVCFFLIIKNSKFLPNHPTLSLSHTVQKTVLYISVSFAVSYTGLLLFLYWFKNYISVYYLPIDKLLDLLNQGEKFELYLLANFIFFNLKLIFQKSSLACLWLF